VFKDNTAEELCMLPTAVRRLIYLALPALLLTSSLYAQHYQRTDLTTNSAAVSPTAPNIDPNLVNAWGLARATGSPSWISDNGTGLTTLYNAAGEAQPLVVKIPTPDGNGSSAPTGAVFNPTAGFVVGGSKALFLFATEDGTIAAWNPAQGTTAALVVKKPGKAIYKGLALGVLPAGPRLYATNFVTGRVDVFTSSFQKINLPTTAFLLPGLTANYSPFGIQNVGGNLVVTFARRPVGSKDEDHGPGLGFVGVFDLRGNLLMTLQHGPWFNAPWGVTLAPGDFGAFTHRLLIGNFGDGTINAFNLVTGKREGTLLDTTGAALAIDGLWALSFGGDTTNNGGATTLFFTAGPNDEADGLFGQVTPAAAEQPGNSQ